MNILQIGWASLNPVFISRDEILLLIHARPSSLVARPSSPVLRFTLNNNPLCELADGDGTVIDNAKLSIADANLKMQTGNMQNEGLISIYPNPVSNILNIEFLMVKGGEFNAELRNLQGTIIMKTNAMPCNPGWHKSNINLHDIPNGAYMLKLTCGDLKEVRKVIVNR